MSINELLQNHPAAKEVVKSWFMEKMIEPLFSPSLDNFVKIEPRVIAWDNKPGISAGVSAIP